jgi:hypothetical protein
LLISPNINIIPKTAKAKTMQTAISVVPNATNPTAISNSTNSGEVFRVVCVIPLKGAENEIIDS